MLAPCLIQSCCGYASSARAGLPGIQPQGVPRTGGTTKVPQASTGRLPGEGQLQQRKACLSTSKRGVGRWVGYKKERLIGDWSHDALRWRMMPRIVALRGSLFLLQAAIVHNKQLYGLLQS